MRELISVIRLLVRHCEYIFLFQEIMVAFENVRTDDVSSALTTVSLCPLYLI